MEKRKALARKEWEEKKTEIHNKIYKYTKKKWNELHNEYRLRDLDLP